MRIKEIVSEATLSVGIQGRNPISAGARGLMGARWKYNKIIDAAEPKNMQNCISRLANELDTIEKIDYASIDGLMQRLGREFEVDPKDMHKEFVKKYKLTPDHYAVKLRHDRANRPKSV
jgi:hypothetical protein